jgi:hypothetical protein
MHHNGVHDLLSMDACSQSNYLSHSLISSSAPAAAAAAAADVLVLTSVDLQVERVRAVQVGVRVCRRLVPAVHKVTVLW